MAESTMLPKNTCLGYRVYTEDTTAPGIITLGSREAPQMQPGKGALNPASDHRFCIPH